MQSTAFPYPPSRHEHHGTAKLFVIIKAVELRKQFQLRVEFAAADRRNQDRTPIQTDRDGESASFFRELFALLGPHRSIEIKYLPHLRIPAVFARLPQCERLS